ncbi:MAG: hypothetical protein V4549_07655 [Bacteroidota bacterium]
MDYERNRIRINQLTALGAKTDYQGFVIGGYLITKGNIAYLDEAGWDALIKNLPIQKTDQEAFDFYISQLNAIQPPVLNDTRLSEMAAIIDNVIKEYTSYVSEELEETESQIKHN